jgi:dUTP pyrophosphatase
MAFLRGYFDGDGSVSKPSIKRAVPRCDISSNSSKMLNTIQLLSSRMRVPYYASKDKISWEGQAAMLFLEALYRDDSYPRLSRKYQIYEDWHAWVPRDVCKGPGFDKGLFRCSRVYPEAVIPERAHIDDTGWDLTIIKKHKQVGDVSVYDTGLRIAPAYGYYFTIAARSSLHKMGYQLANGIGIVDSGYRGNVLVPLLKIDKNASELQLPCRAVQLIPQKLLDIQIEEVIELDDTARGTGGFGSTGV